MGFKVGGTTIIDNSGDISANVGNIDGRDIAADGAKLDGIEANATADQTGAEIKLAYEAETDTNALTDALLNKLNGIETNATSDQTKADIDALNINADQVDGVHASSFARLDTSTRQDFTGSIRVSTNNATGGGIVLADDGDIVDQNDGYCSMRFSNGVRIFSGNSSGSVRHTLGSNGNFTATGNVSAYSDETLKDNIETIKNPLEKLNAIRGVTYNRNDLEDYPRHSGVIAQEVEKVLPEVIQTNDNGIKTVAYGNMVGVLIEAIKEQQTQIDYLKNRIEELDNGSSD